VGLSEYEKTELGVSLSFSFVGPMDESRR